MAQRGESLPPRRTSHARSLGGLTHSSTTMSSRCRASIQEAGIACLCHVLGWLGEASVRRAWRWTRRTSKASLFDSILDKVVRELFHGGDRAHRRRFGGARPRKPRRPNFTLETLEPRLLLSADPALSNGVLTATLTAQG